MRHAWIVASLLLAAGSVRADEWPAWRGPARDGVSAEKGLPEKWAADSGILWKVPLPGAAGATPAVWGENIFVASPSADGSKALLLCIGTEGKPRWERVVSDGVKDGKNLASASPTTDGRHVWAYFGTGDLACFSVAGEPVWKADLQKRYGRFKLQFGMTTTPLVHDGTLYLQLIHSGGACVAALDAATGAERWKVDRKSDGVDECEHSYASVQLWTGGGAAVVVSHGNDYAIGHDPKTGEELWRLGDLNPKESYNKTLRFVSSPVATESLIVVPTAKNGQVVGLDPAARGKVDRANAAGERWRVASGTPDVASPLLYDGLVYLGSTSGTVTCLEAATGKQLYRERTGCNSHFASPVAGDGKVYLTGRDGAVAVVAAGRSFKLLSVNKLGDPLDASPAISKGRIYLRGASQLWAVGAR